MTTHPTTGFDLDEVDRLLCTTKQVRKRLDLGVTPAPRRSAREVTFLNRWKQPVE